MQRILNPGFLQRTDRFLMLNHPVLWMSRIHHTLWRGFWLWVLWALVGAIIPVSPLERFEDGLWYTVCIIVAITFMCFWAYRYIIFNKEKKFGNLKPFDACLDYLLVLFTCAIYLLSPLSLQYVRNERLADLMTDEEYVNMVNDLNLGAPYTLDPDLFVSQYDSLRDENFYNVRYLNSYTSRFTPYSVEAGSERMKGLLSDHELRLQYEVTTDVNKVIAILSRYNKASAIFTKPAITNVKEAAGYYVMAVGMSRIYSNDIILNHYYSYMQNNICDNIAFAKFRKAFYFKWEFLLVMLVITSCLASLLVLFKMVRWRQFLISMLVIMFYPLLLFLFLLVFFGDPDHSYPVLLVLTVWACFQGVFAAWRNKIQFKPIQNIVAQLFYVFMPGIFFFTVVITHATTNLFHQHDLWNSGLQEVGPESPLYARRLFLESMHQYWKDVYDHCAYASYYFGLLLFVLMQPFYKVLFARQNALPVKN